MHSVLEAIKKGQWDFEPESSDTENIQPTAAMPGSDEKLAILAARLEKGLPLWHPSDRLSYDDRDKA